MALTKIKTGGITDNAVTDAKVADNITAGTAATLATARNINGVSFNGSSAITVTAAAGTLTGATLASGVTASSLTSVGTLTGLTVSGDVNFDSNTLFVDVSENKVGIGTGSPDRALHISGGNNVASSIHLTNTAPSPDNDWFIKPQYSDQTLRFLGDDNDVLTLVDTGEVGIGTTSPTSGILVVRGSGDLLTLESTNTGVGGAQLNLNHVGGSQADGDFVGRIVFNGQDSNDNAVTYARIDGIAEDVTDGSENGALNFDTRTSNSAFSTKMHITSAGNVGIGLSDTSVNNKFQVQVGTDHRIGFWGGSTYSAIQSVNDANSCLLYTSPSPRAGLLSRMPSSA